MAGTAQTTDIHIMLGEMRGQLREVVHTMNNTSQKIDALTREVIEVKGIAVTIAAMDVRLTAVEAKVDGLEIDRNQRDGAVGLFRWFVNNWLQILSLVVMAAAILKLAGRI